jgi:hypothetical protein
MVGITSHIMFLQPMTAFRMFLKGILWAVISSKFLTVCKSTIVERDILPRLEDVLFKVSCNQT